MVRIHPLPPEKSVDDVGGFFNEVAVSPLIKELSRFANEEMIAKDFCFERLGFIRQLVADFIKPKADFVRATPGFIIKIYLKNPPSI